MTKVGRNDPCPCGSGRKFKKCCQDKRPSTRFKQADRALALAKLDRFIAEELGPEDNAAFEEFWGPLADRAGELEDDWSELSEWSSTPGSRSIGRSRTAGRRRITSWSSTINCPPASGRSSRNCWRNLPERKQALRVSSPEARS